MTIESIERYLRTRRLRYFRGHADGEYFFILTLDHQRLHVHLELSRAEPEILTVRVTPSCFFPAAHRDRLLGVINTWNGGPRPAEAIVHESSDPTRIGVVAENSHLIDRSTSYDELAHFADETIQSAVDLFGELMPVADPAPASAFHNWVPDAG
jgi:Putative bacterial sensory transduction regulator